MSALPAESRGEAPGRGRLLGRRILVVGAGQSDHGVEDPPIGNGRATAVLCAREGARVVAADRDGRQRRRDGARRSPTSAARLRRSSPTSPIRRSSTRWWPTRPRRSTVSTASSTTSASVPGWGSPAPPETWDTVLAVNLRGAMLTARAALPILDAGASIVFISSVAGLKPGSRIPAYDASKAALGGLMRHVALEGERSRRPRQHRRTGPDGHAARAGRVTWSAVPCSHTGAARPAGDRMGDRVRRRVPAVGRVGVRHRTDPRGRRRAHEPALTRDSDAHPVCSSASERPAASRPSSNATVAVLSGRSRGGGCGIGSVCAVGIWAASRRATPSAFGFDSR